jgi:flagellar biosynthesis protein FliQ
MDLSICSVACINGEGEYPMSENQSGCLAAGAGLVWRRQRVLWWIFVVNLILAGLAVKDVTDRAGAVLNHSMEAARLVDGFDIGTMGMLSNLSSDPLSTQAFGLSGTVYLVFLLFITGGVLEVYRRDVKLSTGDFFEACGAFFWRFLRLMLAFLIACIPVGIFAAIFFNLANKMGDRTISDVPSRLLYVVVAVITLLLVMWLRLWFDMAEVYSVAHNETKIRVALKTTFKLLLRRWTGLYFIFLFIGLVSAALCYGGIWAWYRIVPAAAISLSMVWLQLLILFSIGTRLWQRAAETTWYQNYLRDQTPVYADPVPPREPEMAGQTVRA